MLRQIGKCTLRSQLDCIMLTSELTCHGFLQVAHLAQHFKASAASGPGVPIGQRSFLGGLLPESLLHVLTSYGAGAFAAALCGDADTPELVWTHCMRAQRLVPQVCKYLLPGVLAGEDGCKPSILFLDCAYAVSFMEANLHHASSLALIWKISVRQGALQTYILFTIDLLVQHHVMPCHVEHHSMLQQDRDGMPCRCTTIWVTSPGSWSSTRMRRTSTWSARPWAILSSGRRCGATATTCATSAMSALLTGPLWSMFPSFRYLSSAPRHPIWER